MKFSIKDFFSKCDQIHSFLRIWSRLLKKYLMENFIFYAASYHGNSCSRVFLQRAPKHFAKSSSFMLEYFFNNASSYMTKTVNMVICEEFFEIFCTTCFKLLLRIRLVSSLRTIIKATFLL